MIAELALLSKKPQNIGNVNLNQYAGLSGGSGFGSISLAKFSEKIRTRRQLSHFFLSKGEFLPDLPGFNSQFIKNVLMKRKFVSNLLMLVTAGE
jgi:hypothetical protein